MKKRVLVPGPIEAELLAFRRKLGGRGGTPYSTRRAASTEGDDALLASGGEIGTSIVRMGRRGLSWWDDSVDDDSEKLPLFQRSKDFRRTTRRGGEDGVQVVMVHRNCGVE